LARSVARGWAVLWNSAVQTSEASFRRVDDRFGFTITVASNLVTWWKPPRPAIPPGLRCDQHPVGGSSYFSDPHDELSPLVSTASAHLARFNCHEARPALTPALFFVIEPNPFEHLVHNRPAVLSPGCLRQTLTISSPLRFHCPPPWLCSEVASPRFDCRVRLVSGIFNSDANGLRARFQGFAEETLAARMS